MHSNTLNSILRKKITCLIYSTWRKYETMGLKILFWSDHIVHFSSCSLSLKCFGSFLSPFLIVDIVKCIFITEPLTIDRNKRKKRVKERNVEEINFQRRSRCALFDRMGVVCLNSLVDRSLISFIFMGESETRGAIRITNIGEFLDLQKI